jgi:hypothetical protein
MDINEFDKLFFDKLNKRYNLLEEVPAHMDYHISKINYIQLETNNTFNVFTETELLIIDTILRKFKTKKILEIGAGIGPLSIFLKLCGIDIEACEICSNRVNDFKYFCKEFETDVNIYQVPYQVLNLDKYDVLIAVCIGNAANDFNKDINIFKNLNDNKKFIYMDPFSYEDKAMGISEDKRRFYNFFIKMQNNFFSSL